MPILSWLYSHIYFSGWRIWEINTNEKDYVSRSILLLNFAADYKWRIWCDIVVFRRPNILTQSELTVVRCVFISWYKHHILKTRIWIKILPDNCVRFLFTQSMQICFMYHGDRAMLVVMLLLRCHLQHSHK